MSQQQFDEFMAEQIAAIEASGLEPEVWVEQCAAAFRAAWYSAHAVQISHCNRCIAQYI